MEKATLCQMFIPKKDRLYILKLPFLVRNLVIELMSLKESINLAMTSKVSERVVKGSKKKVYEPLIVFEGQPYIDFLSLRNKREDLRIFIGKGKKSKKREMMELEDFKPWLKQENISHILNTAAIYDRLKNIFSLEGFILNLHNRKNPYLDMIFANPILGKWKGLQLYGKYDANEMGMVMSMASRERRFHAQISKFSVDFKHDNAFKFLDNEYDDARWVRIEDVLALKNCENIKLLRNNFSREDFKTLFDYWINAQVDMFHWMALLANDELNYHELLSEYVYLHYPQAPFWMSLAKTSDSNQNRKKTLLAFNKYNTLVLLTAWAPDERISARGPNNKDDSKYQKSYEILQLLESKNALEKELDNAEKEGKSTFYLDEQISGLVDKLRCLNVSFVNHIATFIG